MALADVLFNSEGSRSGWCSLILSDNRRVVRPTYDAKRQRSNEYTKKMVVNVTNYLRLTHTPNEKSKHAHERDDLLS